MNFLNILTYFYTHIITLLFLQRIYLIIAFESILLKSLLFSHVNLIRAAYCALCNREGKRCKRHGLRGFYKACSFWLNFYINSFFFFFSPELRTTWVLSDHIILVVYRTLNKDDMTPVVEFSKWQLLLLLTSDSQWQSHCFLGLSYHWLSLDNHR